MSKILPTYFISHGGGPWPWVPQMREIFVPLEAALKEMVAKLDEKPKAILMISGHWEEQNVAIMSAAKPPMVYDYSGFPPETYKITYGAPGAPALAEQTLVLLSSAGIMAHLDNKRGFDHGTFAPMAVMFPEADIPLFQVSMLNSYDPVAHLAIGRALAPLREDGVMIVGSGLSMHNLRLRNGQGAAPSAAFDSWLFETMMSDPSIRRQRIIEWENAPYARICHEYEDHLVPLFVALGAAENDKATRIYHNVSSFTGNTVSNYQFG